MDVEELRVAAALLAAVTLLLFVFSRIKNMEDSRNLAESFLFVLFCGFVLVAVFGSAAEATIAFFSKTVVPALQKAGQV